MNAIDFLEDQILIADARTDIRDFSADVAQRIGASPAGANVNAHCMVEVAAQLPDHFSRSGFHAANVGAPEEVS